jgi:hypothetical protein
MTDLRYSSLIFITNAISAWWYHYYVYSFLFCTLTMTSVLHHTMYTPYTKTVDQTLVASVVFYGASMVYHKPVRYIYNGTIWGMYILCLMLYVYGYYTNRFCYHPDVRIGNDYHCLLHVISSVGHHCIIFL